MDDMYPIRMIPIMKELSFGGEHIADKFKRNGNNIAESYEAGICDGIDITVANGKFAGKTLKEVFDVGKIAIKGELLSDREFPVLFRLISTSAQRPVIVHPDDVYADEHENGADGRTELWYVLECEKGAKIVYGLNKELTEQELELAIKSETIENYFNYVEVEEGNAYFIEPGLIHGLPKDILIAEVQQNSFISYVLKDEKGFVKDQKIINKIIDVNTYEPLVDKEAIVQLPIEFDGGIRNMVVCSRHFAVERVEVSDIAKEKTYGRSAHIIFFDKGDGDILYGDNQSEKFKMGDCFIIPADLEKYVIDGKCKYIKSYVPDFEEDFLNPLLNAGYTEGEVAALLR